MNLNHKFCIASLAGALSLSAASAQTLVNFDAPDIIAYTDVTTQYAAQGVTFSGVTDAGDPVNIEAVDDTVFGDVDAFSPPNALSNYYDQDKFNRAHLMVITFSSAASQISFEYNPAGGLGYETVFEVYATSGDLVDSFSDPNATGDGVWYFETIPDTNVGQVVIVNPQSGWGHYVDNLVFTIDPLAALQVTIAPNGAATAGGQWVAAESEESSGATITNLPGGSYNVSFTAISGWITPPDQTVTLTNGETTMTAGLYIPTSTPADGLILLTNGYGTIQHGTWPATLVNGQKYTVTAWPDPHNRFAGWVSGTSQPYALVSSSYSYTFTMKPNLVVEGNFVTNIFRAAQGEYNGLFVPYTVPRQQDNSGSFTLNVTPAGGLSGTLVLGAKSFTLLGSFDINGFAHFSFPMAEGHPLTITLELNPAGQSIEGMISDGSFFAVPRGDQAVFSSTHKAVDYEGNYTLIIPGNTDATVGPFGTSYGTVTVNESGGITFIGSLADGTSVSQSSVVSKDGSWPFYLPLDGGRGSLCCWNSFANGGVTSMVFASWINPTNSALGARYRAGFTNQYASIIGSSYNPTNRPLLDLSSGLVNLDISTNPPTLVNFDAHAIKDLTPVTTQYAAKGVTFSGVTVAGKKVNLLAATDALYSDVNAYSPPNVLSDYYDHSPENRARLMEIKFVGAASGVSFEYNPAGFEGANTVFDVYNTAGALVDSFSDADATNDGVWYLESMPGSDVGRVVIVAPVAGWGHYIDNLTFTINGVSDFDLNNQIALSSNSVITLTSAAENTNKLALTINKSNGLISGAFADPYNPQKSVNINGVLLQNETNAQGYFIGTSGSGAFSLNPGAVPVVVEAKASVTAAQGKGGATNPGLVPPAATAADTSQRNKGPTNP